MQRIDADKIVIRREKAEPRRCEDTKEKEKEYLGIKDSAKKLEV